MAADTTILQCKMCGEFRKLVKAHIIPAALCPHRLTSNGTTKLYHRSPAEYPRKVPIGVWDRTILCGRCENLFQLCDDYGQKVLRGRPIDPSVDHFDLHSFDYPLLKRFFISVLWRASVSNQEMFSRVSVGPQHEARLRQMILQNDPGEPEEYAVWITTFDDPEPQGVVLQPTTEIVGGVRVCRFVLAAFTFFVKVDQRHTPHQLRPAILRPNADVTVVVRKWSTSVERHAVLHVAATAKGP